MDYKEKYNDALETIQEILGGGSDSIKMSRLKLRLQSVFPELKENKNVDDGIRTDLIEFVRQYGDNYYGQISKASAISWLEKQGETSKPDREYQPHKGDVDNPYDMAFEEAQRYTIERGIVTPVNDGDVFVDERYTTQTVGNILRWADEHPKQVMNTPEWNDQDKKMLESIIECIDGTGLLDSDQIDWIKSLKPHLDSRTEKRGEQEPQGNSSSGTIKEEQNDFSAFHRGQKVFSLFHEGDWIVANDGKNIFLIKYINGGYYTLEDINGNVYYPCLPSDNEFHLWTIRDAKDGDVLINYYNEVPFIFKGLLDPNHPNYPVAYCGINYENEFVVSSGNNFWEDCNVKPATKEQRGILFQKMMHAGYKWDAENKVLRKQCKQESADNVEPKFKIGDLIKRRGKNVTFRVDRIQGGYYYCDQQYGSFFPIEEQDEWELIERKKINLINILKYYPKETRLFSPLCGYIWLAEVDEENGIITCYKNPLECGCTRATLGLEETISFYSDGSTGLPDYSITDNCMIFFDMNLTSIDKMGPKFNIGDWIVEKDLDEFGGGIIVAIRDGKYVLNTGRSVPIKEQDEWELVKKDF